MLLQWALVFLVLALAAAFLGFGSLAGIAASIAKILFIVFLVVFAIGILRGGWSYPHRHSPPLA